MESVSPFVASFPIHAAPLHLGTFFLNAFPPQPEATDRLLSLGLSLFESLQVIKLLPAASFFTDGGVVSQTASSRQHAMKCVTFL
jgi:hypothetical protein